jgi:flagellar basal body-associated protein FliL
MKTMIIVAVSLLLMASFAISACMLSSEISQREERQQLEEMIHNEEVPDVRNQDIQV